MEMNEKIAKAIEPNPPTINEEDLPLPWSTHLSPGRGWYAVRVYEEGDVPRWESRKFTNDFELSVYAYEHLIGDYLKLTFEPTFDILQWEARSSRTVEYAETAAEAVCKLIESDLKLNGHSIYS